MTTYSDIAAASWMKRNVQDTRIQSLLDQWLGLGLQCVCLSPLVFTFSLGWTQLFMDQDCAASCPFLLLLRVATLLITTNKSHTWMTSLTSIFKIWRTSNSWITIRSRSSTLTSNKNNRPWIPLHNILVKRWRSQRTSTNISSRLGSSRRSFTQA